MFKYRNHSILLLLLLHTTLVFPQQQHLAFSQLTIENGLSSNFVTDILHDDLGYAWIATREGLNRYDGHSVKVFKHDPADPASITSHDILRLEKDNEGNIWVGTGEGVLHCYRVKTGAFDSFKVPINKEIPVATIYDIEIGQDGNVWLALERGLACFDTITKSFRTWRPSSYNGELVFKWHDVLYSLTSDPYKEQVLWLGARGGLVEFDKEKETFKLVIPPGDMAEHSKGIFDMKTSADGHIWYGASRDAVFKFAPGSHTWEFFQDKADLSLSPRVVTPVNDHEVWVGCYNDGLKHLDTRTGRFTYATTNDQGPAHPIANGIEAIHFGPDGRLWIGAHQGVSMAMPSKLRFRHFDYILGPGQNNEDFIFPTGMVYLEDQKRLFVSTIRGGKNYLIDHKTGEIVHTFDQLPAGIESGNWHSTRAEVDGLGQVWTASNVGLFQVDFAAGKLVIPNWENKQLFTNHYFNRMATDRDGNLWATTYPYGLVHLDVFEKKAVFTDLTKDANNNFPKPEALNDIVVDNKNRLWYGGEPYVVMYDPATGDMQQFSSSEGCIDCLAYSWIFCLAAAPDGAIWIGYKYGGLDRLDLEKPEGERITHFSITDGLPSNGIFKMVFDKNGDLWLATGNGLSRVSGSDFSIKNFQEKDGLRNNDLNKNWVTAIQLLSNGEIGLGGPGYHTLFDPDDFLQKGTKPLLQFNEFKVFDQEKRFGNSLNFTDEISLGHHENFFTFQFADLNFDVAGNQFFRYKLEGFDPDWRTTKTGDAPYTDVGSGRYRFRVQAANGLDAWDEPSELSIRLRIIPPFWKTTWFLSLLGLATVLAIGLVYNYRVRSIRKKEALKAAYNLRLVEAEMKALRSQMNPHFLFNSLNSIKNYIVSKDPRSAANYLTKFARLMRLILNNSKSQSVPLESELQALELYLQLEQMRFPKKIDYKIEVDENVNTAVLSVPPLVLQPYVENAIWHGLMNKQGKGFIAVAVRRENGHIKVEIADDGVGREKANAINSQQGRTRKSMGMQLTADRLRMSSLNIDYKANVEIEDLFDGDGLARGTKVCINIPVSSRFFQGDNPVYG